MSKEDDKNLEIFNKAIDVLAEEIHVPTDRTRIDTLELQDNMGTKIRKNYINRQGNHLGPTVSFGPFPNEKRYIQEISEMEISDVKNALGIYTNLHNIIDLSSEIIDNKDIVPAKTKLMKTLNDLDIFAKGALDEVDSVTSEIKQSFQTKLNNLEKNLDIYSSFGIDAKEYFEKAKENVEKGNIKEAKAIYSKLQQFSTILSDLGNKLTNHEDTSYELKLTGHNAENMKISVLGQVAGSNKKFEKEIENSFDADDLVDSYRDKIKEQEQEELNSEEKEVPNRPRSNDLRKPKLNNAEEQHKGIT